MDSFELNKMAGAFLGVVFVGMSIGIISDAIFDKPAPEKAGYAIEAGEADHGAGGGEAKADAGPEPIAPLLADADVAAGETVFKKCQACHTVEEGGANKVGPNLWSIVDRPVASHEGFNYSSAMKEYADAGATKWTYAHLNAFLEKPKGFVKGTAMGFAGLKKTEDRANLVAYLRTMAPTPAPLPEPAAEGGDTAAAGGEATDGDMAKPEAAPESGESHN